MQYYIYQGEGTTGELQKIATVEDKTTYTATGLKPSTTYRFAVSSFNGSRESAKSNVVTVNTSDIPVSGITLSIDKTSLEVGNTAKVSVTITPADQTHGAATLTSSNTKVATVDASGNVTAVGIGTATITATLAGKTSNVISLTVYEASVTITDLKASDTTATSTTLTWS